MIYGSASLATPGHYLRFPRTLSQRRCPPKRSYIFMRTRAQVWLAFFVYLVTRWHWFAHINYFVQTQRSSLSNRFSIRPYKMVRIASIKGGEIGTPKWWFKLDLNQCLRWVAINNFSADYRFPIEPYKEMLINSLSRWDMHFASCLSKTTFSAFQLC